MKPPLSKILPVIVFAAFFGMAPVSSSAQSSTSFPVTVHVTDQTGASVPDAKVTIAP